MVISKRRLFLYFLIIVSVILLIKLIFSTWDLWRVDERLKKAEVRQEELKKENIKLKGKLGEVKTDEYVEKMAREKLGMGKEGEVVVIMPEVDYKKVKKETRKLANWEKWLKVLIY